ncbi:hypothetical protein NP493_4271g00003 [Ridgeia piscesae]|uniref:Uncharacterized protein n=1 Tax=Ridgeia piscesae TaxID=27915 RepID=A0AAD9MU45_RIDPI|nr:hypothetical protein NP493_4271g00003 [Ridgeia piscesae]
MAYKVTYNVSELSGKDALGADGLLTKQLQNIAKNVSSASRTFNGSWIVDEQATKEAMAEVIAAAKASLKSVCDVVGPVCQNVNFTCSQEKGEVMCVHRCDLFLQKNRCNKAGFLATGTCMLNADSEPYCK